MAKILTIETSTRACSVALSIDGSVKSIEESFERNSHAENITVFAERVVKKAGLGFTDLDAVAVSKGPGSYTGLRIGVSTAKGFCYSLDIPLIAINTLKALAWGMISKTENAEGFLFCPMIDARRMEVYTAVFDAQLNEIQGTEAKIIEEKSFENLLSEKQLVFAGDGAEKCKNSLGHNPNAHFIDDLLPSSRFLAKLAEHNFKNHNFEDVAYFEPFYLKDFIAIKPKVKGLK